MDTNRIIYRGRMGPPENDLQKAVSAAKRQALAESILGAPATFSPDRLRECARAIRNLSARAYLSGAGTSLLIEAMKAGAFGGDDRLSFRHELAIRPSAGQAAYLLNGRKHSKDDGQEFLANQIDVEAGRQPVNRESNDDSAFVPAKECLGKRAKSYKALTRILNKETWIRRRHASSHRLQIHAGDWMRYEGSKGESGWAESDTDHAAQQLVEEVDKRKADVRAQMSSRQPTAQLKRISRKMPQ